MPIAETKEPSAEHEFKIVQTEFDPSGCKTQLAIAAGMSLTLLVAVFGSTVRLGFLSTDFRILRAIEASSKLGLDKLWQLISTSQLIHDGGIGLVPMTNLCLDWFIWHGHSVWYHIENIGLALLCAVFTGQIACQVATLCKSRLRGAPGVWAALLFCVYPAITEPITWISARPHLLLMFFYLATIFFYFRFRLLRERWYLSLSLGSSIAAYFCEPMAWSLPLVITVAELIVLNKADETQGTVIVNQIESPQTGKTSAAKGLSDTEATRLHMAEAIALVENRENTPAAEVAAGTENQELPQPTADQLKKAPVAAPTALNANNISTLRFTLIVFYWAAMFFASTVGIVIPNAVPMMSAAGGKFVVPFPQLGDPGSLIYNLLSPVATYSLQSANDASFVHTTVLILCGLALLTWLIRTIQGSTKVGVIAWLLLWLGASLAPAAQIHLAQQSFATADLFYMCAAPLSLLLVHLCLPIGVMPKKTAHLATMAGCFILSGVAICWTWLQVKNERPWLEAGKAMQELRADFKAIADTGSGKIIVANLPAPIQGIALFPESYSLYAAFAPPFWPTDLTDRLISAFEPAQVSGRQVIWPGLLKNQLRSDPQQTILFWNTQQQRYVRYAGNAGATRLQASFDESTLTTFTCDPPSAMDLTLRRNAEGRGPAKITPLPDVLRLYPGNSGLTLWLPKTPVNPWSCTVAAVKLLYTAPNGCHSCNTGELALVWEGTINTKLSRIRTYDEATIRNKSFDQYLVWLGRYPQWTLSQTIDRIGVRLKPGSYYVDLQKLDLLPERMVQPLVYLKTGSKEYSGSLIPLPLRDIENPELSFDVTEVPQAAGLKLQVSTSPQQASDNSEDALYQFTPGTEGKALMTADLSVKRGFVAVPPSVLKNEGEYQIRAITLNKEGSMVGLGSEPLLVRSN